MSQLSLNVFSHLCLHFCSVICFYVYNRLGVTRAGAAFLERGENEDRGMFRSCADCIGSRTMCMPYCN